MAGPELTEIDVGALSSELKVRKLGIEDGGRNHPDHRDQGLNSSQQKIVQRCVAIVHDAADATTTFIGRKKSRRSEIDNEQPVTKTEGLPDKARLEIERVIQGKRAAIILRYEDYQRDLRALRAFKATHQLTSPAHYPESHIYHWAFIFALMIVEAVANAYFFAKGSDLGLLGGVLQAFLISGVNIGVALFVGVVILPLLNLKIGVLRDRRSSIVFSLAVLVVLVYMPWLIASNLMVAHFRDQLEVSPFDAFNAAIAAVQSFWNSPFAISNFDSWALFAVGFLFASIALVKGYTADDRYPGYGKLDRRLRAAERAYHAQEKELMDAANATFARFEAEVATQIAQSNNLAKEYVKSVAESRAAIDTYRRYHSEIEGICRTLIKEYRASNTEVRTDIAPPYFQDQPDLTGPELEFELDPDEEQRLGEYRRFSESISKISTKVAEEMRIVGREALKRVDDFLEVIKRTTVPADMEDDRVGGAKPDTSAPSSRPA